MDRLKQLEELADNATQGEWHKRRDFEDADCAFVSGNGQIIASLDALKNRDDNAAYIAAANPQTIKRLIELVRVQHEALLKADKATFVSYPDVSHTEDEKSTMAYSAVECAISAYESFIKGEQA